MTVKFKTENQDKNFNFKIMGQESNNGQEIISEQEMEKTSKEREAAEQEFKFIIIGGNEPSVNEVFLESLKKQNIPISIFEMTQDEMRFIVNSRAQKKAEETSVEYLQDEENKKRINEWVKLLINNHCKNMRYKPDYIKMVMDGEIHVYFNRTSLKRASNLSWSQFEELFSSLELFGVVSYDEVDPKIFHLVLNQEDVLKNQISELKQFINLGIGKVISLQNTKGITSEDKKKLTSIKKSLSNVVEKI